jgi:arylformamidase
MKIYDISMTISNDIQVYKNKPDKRPLIETVSDFDYASAYETNITMNLHTGTHMDFPLHMIKNGETSDTLNLMKLITIAKVFDLSHLSGSSKVEDIIKLDIKDNDFVLFKTQNSFEEFWNDQFVYLDKDAAAYLSTKKIKGVGVDGLGVERDQAGHPTHHILFDSNIMIIEGLRLAHITEGVYMMYALPIKIKGVEALPLSVILTED